MVSVAQTLRKELPALREKRAFHLDLGRWGVFMQRRKGGLTSRRFHPAHMEAQSQAEHRVFRQQRESHEAVEKVQGSAVGTLQGWTWYSGQGEPSQPSRQQDGRGTCVVVTEWRRVRARRLGWKD